MLFRSRLDRGFISTTTQYLEKVREAGRPRTRGAWYRFQGLLAWISRTLHKGSLLQARLREELFRGVKRQGKGAELVWGPRAEELWQELLDLLQSPQALRVPDPQGQYILAVDSSLEGVGAVLLQEGEGELQPCSFWSAKWEYGWQKMEAEGKGAGRPSRVLELGGLVAALRRFAGHLRNGRTVLVWSDHRSLAEDLRPLPHDSPRLRRLLAELAEWPLSIRYVPGRVLEGPDWWSREGARLVEEGVPWEE